MTITSATILHVLTGIIAIFTQNEYVPDET